MGYKVLVIDDSPIIYKMIKKAIEPHGFEVIGHAENGKIGLQMWEQLKPDIITLDVTMPVMDGLETAENLMRTDPSVNVILLSAMGDDDLLDKAKSIGLKHFHSKPINSESLVSQMNTILGG